jgi:hypothetical protein
MRDTPQQTALQTVKTMFGQKAWTEDFEHFRRVGCRWDGRALVGMGQTWSEAIDSLKSKVTQ